MYENSRTWCKSMNTIGHVWKSMNTTLPNCPPPRGGQTCIQNLKWTPYEYMYIYIYIELYVYIYTCIHTYIYIYASSVSWECWHSNLNRKLPHNIHKSRMILCKFDVTLYAQNWHSRPSYRDLVCPKLTFATKLPEIARAVRTQDDPGPHRPMPL